jgi:hypothetical protein
MEPKHKDCFETSMHKKMKKNQKQYNEREEDQE